eukprot:2922139-Rhodomonas_salina.2
MTHTVHYSLQYDSHGALLPVHAGCASTGSSAPCAKCAAPSTSTSSAEGANPSQTLRITDT